MENKLIYDSFDMEEFISQQKKKLESETVNLEELLENAVDGRRSSGFMLTYNNFTHTPDELSEKLQTLTNICFIRFQIEKAIKTGTIHYQGYIHFSQRTYWGTIRRALIKLGLHRISHQNRIASPKEAADYCSKIYDKKTGKQTKVTETVYQWGEESTLENEQGKRSDLYEIIERVKQGATNSELLDEYPTQFFRYKKHIESVRKTIQESEYEDKYRHMKIVYISGVPRTGKTRFILEKYGYKNVCKVSIKYDKWLFENYKGQKVVLFDEFNSQVPITEMNEYLEGYPQEYRCRNEDRIAMNDTVIIISNLKLSQQYTKEQSDKPLIYQAFTARIHHIIDWDNQIQREHFQKHLTAYRKLDPSQMTLVELTPEEAEGLPW